MKHSILFIKAEMICRGVNVEKATAGRLRAEHPDYFDKGFIHAVNLRFAGTNANVSIAEDFSSSSPYTLVYDNGYRITGEGVDMPVEFYPSLPKTGTVVDELARLHSDGCINIWPSTVCCYDTPSSKCAFCSLNSNGKAPVDIDELCRGLKILMANLPCGYMLNFSGGTYLDPDNMTRYWCRLAEKIRTFSDCDITVELAPPSDLSLLEDLKAAGVTAVIFNLEIADPELRKKICPGKSSITYEHYHETFRKAVGIFGHCQVSSVLIGGIQPKEDILKECEIMASEGVFPTIMPFRPMDDCAMKDVPGCDPGELLEMSEILGSILVKYDLDSERQSGCTKCGGCSIENDCYKKQMRKITEAETWNR